MQRGLVGSEMCIRDRYQRRVHGRLEIFEMGTCCSNEAKSNVDYREENLNNYELHKEGMVEEYAARPHAEEEELTSSEEILFRETAEKLRLGNEITIEKYDEYGPYEYPPMPNDGVERELRELQKLEEGGQYYGFWNVVSNERDGKGVMVWADGSRYDGFWKNNRANGRGRLLHADGDVYEGTWLDDKAHGTGKYIHNDLSLIHI
eukprot:TRINITY_DN378_c0_g1_i2.p1 TRINITY_DN378_c0_g1~~TRINITY_DN378_c0_g1_i2.p1  ORF type:complete len:205 (-),score=55.59 TRINITY_DN378_c0_g1_i2:130-744(-)